MVYRPGNEDSWWPFERWHIVLPDSILVSCFMSYLANRMEPKWRLRKFYKSRLITVHCMCWESCSVSWRNNWRPPSNNCVRPLLISWKMVAKYGRHYSIASLGNKIRMVSQQVLTKGAKESEVSTHCLILLNGIINWWNHLFGYRRCMVVDYCQSVWDPFACV